MTSIYVTESAAWSFSGMADPPCGKRIFMDEFVAQLRSLLKSYYPEAKVEASWTNQFSAPRIHQDVGAMDALDWIQRCRELAWDAAWEAMVERVPANPKCDTLKDASGNILCPDTWFDVDDTAIKDTLDITPHKPKNGQGRRHEIQK